MNFRLHYFFATLLFLLPIFSKAQSGGVIFHPDTLTKVFSNGDEKTLALAGGFNNPQFAVGDLNNDGKNDLVVYENGTQLVRTFINFGTAGNPDYKYIPKYADSFPVVYHFLKLADYNCDNVPDLIQRGYFGFAVWKGYYNSDNVLSFKFYKDLFYPGFGGMINAYSEPSDIPAVADVDNDGDLDFLAYDITGGTIYWYKNMQVEDGLPCDSVRISIGSTCWGKVLQGFVREQTLGYSCAAGGTPAPPPIPLESESKTTLHTGNTLCLADVDGDGDYDYFNGSISFPDVQFLKNGRVELNAARDTMISEDTMWQSNGHQLNLTQWPAPFWVDMDNDGDHDLLFSPHAENASENYKTIALYRNTATDAAPVFEYVSDTFLVEETIDMGAASHPAVYDFNKDGKPDLFVGADGFYQNNGTLKARIAYFENTSTPNNPSFEMKSLNFANVDSLNIRGAAPSFGDLDNDGKDDMVIGHGDGSLSFYKNTATSNNDIPRWQLTDLVMKDASGNNIDSGNVASPFIYDLDGDGKKDLIIGVQTGWFYFYKNISTTAGNLQLQYVTGKLGLAKADPENLVSGYSTPFIGRLDNSGQDYLLTGSSSGLLYRFSGFGNGNVTAPFQREDSAYSLINSKLTLYSGFRSAPVIADFDGDHKLELVLGNVFGGITMFRSQEVLGIVETAIGNTKFTSVYPNPAKDKLNIAWSQRFAKDGEQVFVTITGVTGAKLYQKKINGNQLQTEISLSLAAGLYFCTVTSGEGSETHRFMVQ